MCHLVKVSVRTEEPARTAGKIVVGTRSVHCSEKNVNIINFALIFLNVQPFERNFLRSENMLLCNCRAQILVISLFEHAFFLRSAALLVLSLLSSSEPE